MSDTRSDAVTQGVRITVESRYVPEQSAPRAGRYVFAYHVLIVNEGHAEVVELVTRHWIITNQLGETEEVRGPGVVGQHPRLGPGDRFEYTSGAVLKTPRGSMRGSYQFARPDGTMLDARIAPFTLAMPHTLN